MPQVEFFRKPVKGGGLKNLLTVENAVVDHERQIIRFQWPTEADLKPGDFASGDELPGVTVKDVELDRSESKISHRVGYVLPDEVV